MSTLINLLISFFMAFLFGQQVEETKTVHHEYQKETTEIFKGLEARQQMLES